MSKTIKFDPIPLHELIKVRIGDNLNNVYVYYKQTDKKYTFREILYYSDKVVNALYELGI